MDVLEAHDSSALREHVGQGATVQTAGYARMEAGEPGHAAGYAQPMSRELLQPLLPGAHAAPPRLEGRQPAYVQQVVPGGVPYAMIHSGGAADHYALMDGRGAASGMVSGSSQQFVPVEQASIHALPMRRPGRVTIFDRQSIDRQESPYVSRQGSLY